MTSTISRRTLAKGTLWAAPVIVATTAAPAMAASPCGVYKARQPLPASAFTVTYLNVTNETLGGGAANKQVAIEFGFRISDEATSCGVTSGSISSSNSDPSRVTLSNNTSYNVTNGGGVPANGNVGTVDTSCQSGRDGTQACGTSGVSAYDVSNSKNTSGSAVQQISLSRSITVSGYGTTLVYLNATIPTTGGFPHRGTGFSVTASPAI